MKSILSNATEVSRRDAMKRGVTAASLAALGAGAAVPAALTTVSVVATTGAVHAQPTASPAPTSNVTQPASGITMQPEYGHTLAQTAYLWGWPMVNMMNRRAMFAQSPYPGLLNGVVPVAPTGQVGMLSDYVDPGETFVTCPNQDVVYGLGFFDLDTDPVIAQVPDSGNRFWVYALCDARTDQIGQLGKPYNTKPGFYLIVGPKWDGRKPAGIAGVVRSPTSLANAIPRIFQDDTAEDRKAIQSAINQVVFYPLKDFTGKMKTIEWSKAPNITGPKSTGEETKWVVPEKFFDELNTVLDTVPPLPGEQAMYAQLRQLLDAANKDLELKKVLVAAALDTEQKVIHPFFQWKYNGPPAGNGWNRSTNNAQWGIDYYNRTGTAKSNMFDNRPTETQYFYTDLDGADGELTGSGNYEITFAKGQEPPVKGFWSLT
jgi:hypothetical protein